MNYTWKSGDKVKLNPEYIDFTNRNPALDETTANCVGKVINHYHQICSVEWDNDNYYLYRNDMLVPYEERYIEEDGEY